MKYTAPEMNIVKFNTEDVIVASTQTVVTTTTEDVVPGEDW